MKSDIQAPSTNTLIKQDDTWQKITLHLFFCLFQAFTELVRALREKSKKAWWEEAKERQWANFSFASSRRTFLLFRPFARIVFLCAPTNWKRLLFYYFPTINIDWLIDWLLPPCYVHMNATALHAIIFDRVFDHVSQCVYICVLLERCQYWPNCEGRSRSTFESNRTLVSI